MEQKIQLSETQLRNLIKESVKKALKEEESFDNKGRERGLAFRQLMNMGDDSRPTECDPEGTRCVRHSFDFVVPGDEYYHKMVIKSTKEFSWDKLNNVVKCLFGDDAKLSGGMGNSTFPYNGYDIDRQ